MKNTLGPKQQAIVESAAFAAKGDQTGLKKSLISGFEASVTINEFKEILTQLYAYCGFPCSLNALNTLMTLVNERENKDMQGAVPSALPSAKSLDVGTANQTRLVGFEVKGALYEFAPAIDEYLKAHLFGDIFSRDNLDWKTRELATISMLSVLPGAEAQLKGHIAIGKHNGLSAADVASITDIVNNRVIGGANTSKFPFGNENTGYAKYFSGRSWLAPMTSDKCLGVPVFNVTFEPGCRNNWHKHTGGQMLIAVGGVGYYQERDKPARRLVVGDVVEIAPDVEHWHGASPDSWFSHLAIECNPSTNKNTWLEPVSDTAYQEATK